MRTRRRLFPTLGLAALACAGVLLGSLPANADTGRPPPASAPTLKPPSNGPGIQLEIALGGGADSTFKGASGSGGSDAVIGVGLAAQLHTLTVGARFELDEVLFYHRNDYVFCDIGAHERSGRMKLTGVLELGAHQFVDVGSGFLSHDESNSTFLPTVGLRASLDFVSRSGPMIGWWLAYHHDLGATSITTSVGDRFALGGDLVATGLQIGIDSRPSGDAGRD